MTTKEETIALPDGRRIYTKTWTAHPERARLLFLHGFSDHSNNYVFLFDHLSSHGISIHSFDQRGWGQSCAANKDLRGRTGPTATVYSDISFMLRRLIASGPDSTPVFLLGHSMGGLNVLSYTASDPDGLVRSRVRGTVASAPLIGLHPASRPNALVVTAGRLAERLFPYRQLVNKLDNSLLSRDEEQNAAWDKDPLNHDTGTLQGLVGMFDRMDRLGDGRDRIGKGAHEGGRGRVLVVHGTGDKINDFEATKAWWETYGKEIEDGRLWSLDGWYHNLHVEPEKEMFAKGLLDWFLERSGPLEGGQA